jgi:gluconolactonase
MQIKKREGIQGDIMLYPVSEVRVFVAGLDHPECVTVGPDGTLYAGGERGQVYRISADGKRADEIATTGGFCLGLTLDREENIYICDLAKHALMKVTQKGAVSMIADSVDGVKMQTPNFSVFDSKGNLYFSDSGQWKTGNGVVWRLSHDGAVKLFAAGPFHFANGIALDAQDDYLYVVESNRDRVVRIEINADGSAGQIEIFAEGLARIPDGLAFDAQGNLYVTTYASNCIYRVSPDRKIELLCKDEENLLLCQPTNCAFGGPNFDQLYVSNLGRDHISVLDLNVKGQPLHHP